MEPTVLCIGDALIDAFLTIHNADLHCHVNESKNELCIPYGGKIPVAASEYVVGGNACNVAVGFKRLGIRSVLAAEIGTDEFSHKISLELHREGIDTNELLQTPGAVASFAVGIEFQNERTLFVSHQERSHHFKLETNASYIYLTSLGKEWRMAYQKVLQYKDAGNRILAFSPGSMQLEGGYEGIADVLSKTDYLFLNKEEGEGLVASQSGWSTSRFSIRTQQKLSIEDIMRGLKNLGPNVVVMTDGTRGSYVLSENEIYHLDIIPVSVVEKTGAGDSFATGFLSAIIQGKNAQEALLWGAINAAAVIGKVGAQAGLLTESEMKEKLKEQKHFYAKKLE